MADLLKQWGFSNGYHGPSQSDAALSVGIKAPWWRVDLNWGGVESAGPGVRDWATPDAWINAVLAAGGKPFPCIAYAPSWASTAGGNNKPPSSAHFQDYANFCAAAVTRYAALGVDHFELWNEPNLSGFWGGVTPDPVALASMMKLAYPAMKQAAAAIGRSIIVCSAGLSPAGTYSNASFQVGNASVNELRYLEALYANGISAACDAIGAHPYTTFYEQSELDATSPSFRSLMTAHGDSAKLIHATEWGFESTTGDQSAYIVNWTNWWASKPWAGIATYYLFRAGDNGGDVNFQSYALRDSSNVAKPGWTTYASQITALGTGGTSGGGGGGGGGGGTGTQSLVQALKALAPVSLWQLGEPSGTFADTVIAGHALTLSGTATRATPSLSGDTTDLSVTLAGGTLSGGDIYRFAANAPYTLVALIDPTALPSGAFNGVFTKADLTAGGYEVWLNNTGTAYRAGFQRGDGTTSQSALLTTASIAPGAKILVVAVYDGTNEVIYINKESVTNPSVASPAGSTAPFVLGGGGDTSALSAVFDTAAVFNYALTAAQVSALVDAIPVAPAGTALPVYVGELASGGVATSGTAVQSFTLTAGAHAGNAVLLAIGFKANAAITVTVADARGNAWTVDRADVQIGSSNAVILASTQQDRGTLQAGDTITVTLTGDTFEAGSSTVYWIEEFGNLLAGADQGATDSVFGSLSVDTGTTGATTVASEVAIAVVIWGSTETSITPSAFTSLGIKTGPTRSGGAAYKILTAKATQTETFTAVGTADNALASIATYKTSTAQPPPPTGARPRTLQGVGV